MKQLLLILLFLVAIELHKIEAQISYGGQPYSFTNNLPELSNRSQIELAKPDIEKLQAQDLVTDQHKDIPLRFGYKHEVDLGISNAGEWTMLQNGDRIWRLAVACPEAKSINFAFDRFYLPEGSSLFIYDEGHTNQLGAYNFKSNNATKSLGVGLLFADNMVIEYYEPASKLNEGILHIKYVTHGYRNVFKHENDLSKDPFGSSGNCNNNVICPIGDPWSDQIRSVALIVVGGDSWCTGSMVNNTSLDGTPYFLTANHCTQGESVTNWVYYFNHESTLCTGNIGPTDQSVQGSTMKAHNDDSDFSLLLLTETIPADYNVYFSGWDRSIDPEVTSATGIHHPSGDVKKITLNNGNTLTYSTWFQTPVDSHWHTIWDDGVTEGGSSGSPLYDQNKRIIGQLHGGASICGGSDLSDDYGKFSVSWDGISPTSRLKDWLDPNNLNVSTLDGLDDDDVIGLGENKIQGQVTIYPNPSNGRINLSFENAFKDKNTIIKIFNNLGEIVLDSNITNPTSDLVLDCTTLKAGIYTLQCINEKNNFIKKLIIEK